MSTEDQNLSEELEKLESISGRRNEVFTCEDNPFQRRSKCSSRPAVIWPTRCHCPYLKRSTKNTVTFKRHNGKILKQPTFKYAGTKLDELGDALQTDVCISENNIDKTKCNTFKQQSLDPMSDITIYELASYFEVLVDIPKQMSTMAEMMYM
ncbi:uncharacterized protein LOC143919543 [Arctopsyche grandis]|uniref:uncharacterized protein LOC143919543 n=1 Tax=Arctopsyche grandis TaxID=121162 RepID=UPI00406D833C